MFVHGCFWHRHPSCNKASLPKSRTEYWQAKFDANMRRDALAVERLEALGWHVETIWECETKDGAVLAARLENIFGLQGPQAQAASSP